MLYWGNKSLWWIYIFEVGILLETIHDHFRLHTRHRRKNSLSSRIWHSFWVSWVLKFGLQSAKKIPNANALQRLLYLDIYQFDKLWLKEVKVVLFEPTDFQCETNSHIQIFSRDVSHSHFSGLWLVFPIKGEGKKKWKNLTRTMKKGIFKSFFEEAFL